MTPTPAANAAQISYWNEVSGPKWAELGDVIDAQIAPIGADALDAAAPASGERVLDVGCGCGHTTVELARRVGASGEVVGIDISGPMLADAERRAAAHDGAPIRFLNEDAQTYGLPADHFDLAFSRFGVMFFDDPSAAFANLRSALAPGGRLVFVCWQGLVDNPWMRVPVAAVAKHLDLPKPADPTAPGPFAFADPDRVRTLVGGGGFGEVSVRPIERTLVVGAGRTMPEIVEFLMQMGPAGAALREASEDAALVEAVRASMREALEPYFDGSGLQMAAAAWLVEARRS